mmetsp:Transcript_1119/g.1918  ORF Transcript_1119/g.1918 Transcript_1119/m.1918 type:complete len:88 (+) Transcript_1119:153-416(+)
MMAKKKTFTVQRIKSMLKIFSVQHLRKECLAYEIPASGSRKDIESRIALFLYGRQPKNLKSRPHPQACSCDICDLELAAILDSITIS